MSSRYSITAIFEQFGASVKQQGHLQAEQLKTLELIRQCRTGALGSHKERCTGCGYTKVHYNSCGNRHCSNYIKHWLSRIRVFKQALNHFTNKI